MKRGLIYLLVGLSAFLIFLVARFPASVAYGWLQPASFSLTGVEGTVWRGGAQRLAANGVTLGRTGWRFHVPSLLRGQAGYSVTTEFAGLPAQGVATIALNGSVRLRKVRADLPLSIVARALPRSAAGMAAGSGIIDGVLSMDLERVALVAGWPTRINGRVTVKSLETTRPRLSLGSFEAVFDDQDEAPLVGEISDTEGPLDFAGTVSLNDDHCYTLEWKVAPRAEAAPEIQQILPWLGAPAADGSRQGVQSECM